MVVARMYNTLVPTMIMSYLLALIASILVFMYVRSTVLKLFIHIVAVVLIVVSSLLLRPLLLVMPEGTVTLSTTKQVTGQDGSLILVTNQTTVPRYVQTPYGDTAVLMGFMSAFAVSLMALYEGVELVIRSVRIRRGSVRVVRR